MNQSHISHLNVDVDNHNTHSNTVKDIANAATSILIDDAITHAQEQPSEKDEEFDENGHKRGRF